MCGLLHCEHGAEKLAFWKEALTLTLPETWVHTEDGRRHDCHAVILDVGLDMVDPGMVLDGTRCGQRRVSRRHDQHTHAIIVVVVVVVVVVLEVVVVIFMQSPVTLSPSTFFLNLCRKSNTNSNTDSSPQWKSGRSY